LFIPCSFSGQPANCFFFVTTSWKTFRLSQDKAIMGSMTHKTNQSGRNYKDFMIQENSRERSRKEKKNKATFVQKMDSKGEWMLEKKRIPKVQNSLV